MPAALIPREEVVRRLFGAFRTHGYEGASLARLSEATGLGRASLYHYFPDGKEGMAREVLGVAEQWLRESVVAPLQRGDVAPATRVRTAIRNLRAGYDDGAASCLVNLLGIGDARNVAAAELAVTAKLYLSGFAAYAESCGLSAAKAREVAAETVAAIEGSLVLARALDDRSIFTKTLARIETQYIALAKG